MLNTIKISVVFVSSPRVLAMRENCALSPRMLFLHVATMSVDI